MKKQVKAKPSASLLISRVEEDITEDDIKDFFRDFLPLDNIVFHYISPKLFTNKVTASFPSQEACVKAAKKLLGKHMGPNDFKVEYSLRPNDSSLSLEIGETEKRVMMDDPDVPDNMYAPGIFMYEWQKATELPNIPVNTVNLWLRFNHLKSFDKAFAKVTTLNLKGNDIQSFGEDVEFPVLKTINISYNRFQCMPDFGKLCPLVEYIDVSSNLLSEVHESISNLEYLNHLDISHNRITHLPLLPKTVKHLFAQCNSIVTTTESEYIIDEISIWKNKLTKVPMFARGRVDEVCCCHNRITSFSNSDLLPGLTTLNLCMNGLDSIPPEVFLQKTLRSLILFGNNIREIPIELSKNSSLQLLDISENPIDHLPMLPYQLEVLKINFCGFEDITHFIPKMNQLKKLYMVANKVKEIPPMPYLEELLIAYNNISAMPKLTVNFMNPMTIDVSHNQISQIEPIAAPCRLLDYSFNQISSITDAIFKGRSHICFKGNPIQKKFRMKSLQRTEALDIYQTKEGPTIELDGDLTDNAYEIVSKYTGSEVSENTVNIYFDCDDSIGYSEMVGCRSEMEDALIIRQHFKPGISLFGVFDGHGGSKSARYAAVSFPELLAPYDEITEEVINEVCAKFNEVLISTNDLSGTTMDLVRISGNNMKLSHLGDGKVLVYRNDGSYSFKTSDLKPYNRSEMERLRDLGIKLRRMRTAGTLAMSRALGDIQINGVSHMPVHFDYTFQPNDKWLVLACDGVWDDSDIGSVGKTLLSAPNPHIAATLIRDQAYSRGSEDNISVIVIDLSSLTQ